ncbi:MAG TPA: hypothetical protein VES20_08495 [Bryobacteraceae bacterium]|nr:hypothetical protein [Bryobacteraceae bacterium]
MNLGTVENADVVSSPEPVPVAAPAASPPPVSLRNPLAVRMAFTAGGITALLLMIRVPAIVQYLWIAIMLFAGGFAAVWLYQRRSGAVLSTRAGAALGWMTGLFCFLVLLVVFTLDMVRLAATGSLSDSFRQILEQHGSPERTAELRELLALPGGVGFLIFGTLVLLFIMLTVVPAAGGAVGSRVLDPD